MLGQCRHCFGWAEEGRCPGDALKGEDPCLDADVDAAADDASLAAASGADRYAVQKDAAAAAAGVEDDVAAADACTFETGAAVVAAAAARVDKSVGGAEHVAGSGGSLFAAGEDTAICPAPA